MKFSGLTQEKVFSDNFGAAASAIFEFESHDDFAYISADELGTFIRDYGKGRFENAKNFICSFALQ